MIDLGKPLGKHEGLQFYGDHENDKIVYYLPDEVTFARTPAGDAEMHFTTFNPETSSGTANIKDSAGSLLSVGVICDVSQTRLTKALNSVKAAFGLPDGVTAMTPPWNEGTVDMITLDASKSDYKDTFVKKIVGSAKPSLGTADLKSIFNVRFDHEGTQLIDAAIRGENTSILGVMYDLKYTAIRPAVDLRITADLSRCQKTAQHNLGIDFKMVYYVDLSIGAQMEWLTKKMEENGDIKVELFCNVDTPEQKKAVDELVKEFKEDVLKELFEPFPDMENQATVVSDPKQASADNLVKQGVDAAKQTGTEKGKDDNKDNAGAAAGKAAGKDGAAVPPAGDNQDGVQQKPEVKPEDQQWAEKFHLGITYSMKKHEIELNKKIVVDYRERTAIVKPHTPSSQVFLMKKEGESLDKYITSVTFGEKLFKEQEVEVHFDHPFAEGDNLDTAEVRIWRKCDGIDETVEQGFAIPPTASPLACYTFMKDDKDTKTIKWFCKDASDVGYYYQIRMAYGNPGTNMVSPREVWTAPLYGQSQDLLIKPDSMVFYKKYPIRISGVNFDVIPNADVNLTLNPESEAPERKIFHLDKDHPQTDLIIRGADKTVIPLLVEKVFYFNDGRSPVKTDPVLQIDDEIILNNPIVEKEFMFVLSGLNPNITNVMVSTVVESKLYDVSLDRLLELPNTGSIQKAKIPIYSSDDTVQYTVSILDSGKFSKLQEGEFPAGTSDPILIDFSLANKKKYTLFWQGGAPEDMDLKSLSVIIKDAEGAEVKSVTFSGPSKPAPIEFYVDSGKQLTMDIERKYAGGSSDSEKDAQVNSDVIIIRP